MSKKQTIISDPFGISINKDDDEEKDSLWKDQNLDIDLNQTQNQNQQQVGPFKQNSFTNNNNQFKQQSQNSKFITNNNTNNFFQDQQSQSNVNISFNQQKNNSFFDNSQSDLQGNINLSEQTEPIKRNYSNNGQDTYDEQGNLIEPPLLEDLGIDLELIKQRTLSVIKMQNCDEKFLLESDMIGPILLSGVLGTLLLLTGKVHFGYIFGFWISGSIGIYIILNYLSQTRNIGLYNVVSILGYCLIPIVIFAGLTLFFKLFNLFFIMQIFALAAIVWSTFTASTFFNSVLQLNHQKALTAYPTFLFYMTFVLITIF